MSLHDKKYIIIRKIISKELAKVYYDYMINKEKTCYTLINNGQINLGDLILVDMKIFSLQNMNLEVIILGIMTPYKIL